MRNVCHGRANQRGNSLVEFAISLPLMVSLFLGVWQFGYSYYLYGRLEAAVRDGGRYASIAAYDAADPSDYQDRVRNVVLYGDPTGGQAGNVVSPGLRPEQVSVAISPAGGPPDAVSVAINGYQLPGIFSRVVLNGKPAVQFPFLGHWAPL